MPSVSGTDRDERTPCSNARVGVDGAVAGTPPGGQSAHPGGPTVKAPAFLQW